MSTLAYHKKPNGTTYVYWQESYWDKSRKRSATRQVCIGKLGDNGEVVYNKRFSHPAARKALDEGMNISGSVITGQSLVLNKATQELGLERVVRKIFDAPTADLLLSLAWATVAADGRMHQVTTWIHENECPSHKRPLNAQEIPPLLASVTQNNVDDFLRAWMSHRDKGAREQHCFDINLAESFSLKDSYVEWSHFSNRSRRRKFNIAIVSGATNAIPTYYEILPGPLTGVVTIKAFCDRIRKLGTGRLQMILDKGIFSAINLERLLDNAINFYMPMPTHIKAGQALIDSNRDDLEMPEHLIETADDKKNAVYGITIQKKIGDKRVWYHVYYDIAQRTKHILTFFDKLDIWEQELASNKPKYENKQFYDRYFTVTESDEHGVTVTRNLSSINEYKNNRAGYWIIVTNCEKDAGRALHACREQSHLESQFDGLKKEMSKGRLETYSSDSMRGYAFVQFLALIIHTQIKTTLDTAWETRKDVRAHALSRNYSTTEMMLRLGSYRKTRFAGLSKEIASAPTEAQKQIFKAFGIKRF